MYARDGWTSSSSSSSSSISSTSSARSKGRIAQVLASARASLKDPTRPVTPQSIDEKLNKAMGLVTSTAASSVPLRNTNMRFSKPPSSSLSTSSSDVTNPKRVDEVYDLLSGRELFFSFTFPYLIVETVFSITITEFYSTSIHTYTPVY